MEVNRYHHSASSTLFILGYFETLSSLIAFLVVASKLGKFKLLCSLGCASVETKVFKVGTVISLLAKKKKKKRKNTILDQSSHWVMLLIEGTSNQKSKFHASFGNSPLASCHPASCQGKSSYGAGGVGSSSLQGPSWGAEARGQGCSCPTLLCSARVSVPLGMRLKWIPLNSFLAEIL